MILSCLTYDLCALDLFIWLCQELQPDLKGRHKQQSPVRKCFHLFEYHGCLSKGSIIIDIRQNRVDDYTMMIIWAKITRPGNIVPGRESKSCSQWLKFILINHHIILLLSLICDMIKSPYHHITLCWTWYDQITYERKSSIVIIQLRFVHIAVLLIAIEVLVEVHVHLF